MQSCRLIFSLVLRPPKFQIIKLHDSTLIRNIRCKSVEQSTYFIDGSKDVFRALSLFLYLSLSVHIHTNFSMCAFLGKLFFCFLRKKRIIACTRQRLHPNVLSNTEYFKMVFYFFHPFTTLPTNE